MRKFFTVCYCTGIKITFFAVLWTNNLFVVKLQRKARAELMAPEHPSQHFNNQWLDKGQESPVFILCHITAACSVSPAQTLRGLNQVYEKACESLHCRKFGPVGLGAKNTEAVCVYTQSCIVVAPPQKKGNFFHNSSAIFFSSIFANMSYAANVFSERSASSTCLQLYQNSGLRIKTDLKSSFSIIFYSND